MQQLVLPVFRMLINSQGQAAPEVVLRQDGSPFARVLRLTVDPARLSGTDLAQYQHWFGTDSRRLLSITNPDDRKRS